MPLHLLAHLSSEGQGGCIQTQRQTTSDASHTEISPFRKGGITLQSTVGNSDGQDCWNTGEHGTAIGSPVSVSVANLVMEDIEERALSTFHSPPHFWMHYVDDMCAAPYSTPWTCNIFMTTWTALNCTCSSQWRGQMEDGLSWMSNLVGMMMAHAVSTLVYHKASHTKQHA